MDYEKLISQYRELYDFIGEGRNRIVFKLNEDYVIKIPKNEEGEGDNSYEESIYLKNKDTIYAECSLIFEYGIPLLKMQMVNVCQSSKNIPKWVEGIDCSQVGYTNDGELVAFDFGYY